MFWKLLETSGEREREGNVLEASGERAIARIRI